MCIGSGFLIGLVGAFLVTRILLRLRWGGGCGGGGCGGGGGWRSRRWRRGGWGGGWREGAHFAGDGGGGGTWARRGEAVRAQAARARFGDGNPDAIYRLLLELDLQGRQGEVADEILDRLQRIDGRLGGLEGLDAAVDAFGDDAFDRGIAERALAARGGAPAAVVDGFAALHALLTRGQRQRLRELLTRGAAAA